MVLLDRSAWVLTANKYLGCHYDYCNRKKSKRQLLKVRFQGNHKVLCQDFPSLSTVITSQFPREVYCGQGAFPLPQKSYITERSSEEKCVIF